MEEEDVRGDRGLSVFRLRAVSRLTLVVRCTEIGYSVSTQVLGFRFGCGWCCVVGFLFGCCWFCVLLLCVSAWWNRGIADEVTMASYGRAVTGTAVMARSANEEKKIPQKHPLHRRRDYVNRPDVVYTQHRVNADRQGQGVLLVTEPHSELNAGLVVVFSSAHPSIFNWSEWTRRCRCLPDTEYNSLLSSASEKVVQEFLKLLGCTRCRPVSSVAGK